MREDVNEKYKKSNSVWQTLKLTFHYISKILLWSIFLILIIAAITLIVYFVDLKKNIESGENTIPLFNAYVIISPSMEPAIKVQDAVVVMRVDPKNLDKNDIITFDSKDPRYSGITITHRIVGVEHKGTKNALFRTKGDNNNTDDSALVKGEDIYGKVILRLPKIGYIQYFLSQKFGWIIAIVLPCLAIIIYDIIKLIKTIKYGASRKINKKNNIPKTVSSENFEKEREEKIKKLKEELENENKDKEKDEDDKEELLEEDLEILDKYVKKSSVKRQKSKSSKNNKDSEEVEKSKKESKDNKRKRR